LRSHHRSRPRPRLVRRQQWRNRRHLRLENQTSRRVPSTGVVQPVLLCLRRFFSPSHL
jgi:hypothetical protein